MYRKLDISFGEIPQLSSRDKAYQLSNSAMRPFYKFEPNFESFEDVIEQRRLYEVDRKLLVDQLLLQYDSVAPSESTLDNIHALSSSNTFTVITAHQPSLLTGPLYFIYKICSAISLARRLSDQKKIHVVPVFIMGGEDHDFEEIATAHIFGKSFTWETEQVGSTGRMKLDGLEKVLSEVNEKLGESDHALNLSSIIESSFKASETYGQFMFHFVHEIFKDTGLVIANMDNTAFKERLLPYVIQDIKDKNSVACVQRDQNSISEAGYKPQAHAREVNIFWLDQDRQRVVAQPDGAFAIGATSYTADELIKMMRKTPGAISPNVILRPIYQEVIMPNLAYIGGGGELAYWLERKSLFEEWELPFPMLIRRDSIKIIDKRSAKWLKEQGVRIMDLFEREEKLIGKFAEMRSTVDLDSSKSKQSLTQIFEEIKSKAQSIDATLGKTVSSEMVKSIKSIDYLTSKMLKAEKQKNEVAINKLTKMKHKFFPGNDGLQERYDNFIPYYLRYGKEWIDEIIAQVDPMNRNFKILIEE